MIPPIASWDDRVLFPPAGDPTLDPAPPPVWVPALFVPWGQIAAIVVIATAVAWFNRFGPPVPWNAMIWLGSSITIAFLFNKGAARLFFAPFLALVFVAAVAGNEAVAHHAFGTCLSD